MLVEPCLGPFQLYFSYIVAVSFIGGGNRSTRRKQPTCCKSLTNLSQNVESSRPPLSRIQTHNVVVTGTDCIGSYNSHFNTITTTMALIQFTEFTSEHDEMFNK